MATRLVRVLSVAAVAVGLTYGLGGYPLLEPDEGRNAEVAREMAEANDYVLPRLNGLPYLDKPVLFFAASALVFEVMGPGEAAARLPALIFTVATLVVVVLFARRVFGPAGAWTAAIAYAASPFTVAYARTVIFDSAVTLWIVAALAAFYLAIERRDGGARSDWWPVIAWLSMGLGVLTKGPVALAVPLMVVIPYAMWRRRARPVLDPVGILSFVALVLPWILLIQRQIPDFVQYAVGVETVERLTTTSLGRTGPVWYFFPILVGAALPWTVAATAGIARDDFRRPRDPTLVFLAMWIAIPLLFFTLSQSKRPQYILPLVPAVALLTAYVWSTHGRQFRAARAAGGALVIFGLGVVLARGGIADLVRTSDAVASRIPSTALTLGLVSLGAGVTAVTLAARRDLSLFALALPVLAIPPAAMPLMRAIGEDRSSASLAVAIARAAPPDTEVIAVGTYPLSLAFYLGGPLTLVTADASELTSNYIRRHASQLRRVPGSPLRPPGWWEHALAMCDRPRVFVTRIDDEAARRRIGIHLPQLATTRKVAAYGPCGVRDLARAGG